MGALRLGELNRIDGERLVELAGDLCEASPWVAESAADFRPFTSRAAMRDAFVHALHAAPREAQLAVIRAHPDLGARLDELSTASRAEQTGAGLAALTPAERARLAELNAAYRAKFGFPFIVAVKGAAAADILAAFEARLPNGLETEFATALGQVERIIANRIDARIEEG